MNTVYYQHCALASGVTAIIASILIRASAMAQRVFPGLPVRLSAYPSSSNKGGKEDMGFHLGARRQVSTMPRGHENTPDKGQVGEA